jgi:hypothetical protein
MTRFVKYLSVNYGPSGDSSNQPLLPFLLSSRQQKIYRFHLLCKMNYVKTPSLEISLSFSRLQTPSLFYPGLPDGRFLSKKSHFGYSLKGLGMKNVGVFYGHWACTDRVHTYCHFVYFVAI